MQNEWGVKWSSEKAKIKKGGELPLENNKGWHKLISH